MAKETYGDFYENEGKPLVVILGGSRSGLNSVQIDLLNLTLTGFPPARIYALSGRTM